MPRQPRNFVPGLPQHVVTRGVDRQATFFRPQDYALYIKSLGEAASTHGCAIHAYVLMTNHVYLLVTPASKDGLPLVMQAMGRKYVQSLNKQYARTGTLWEGRYKASLIQDECYLLTCQRYIELNPVRAGIVESPDEYPYSSYACNALGKPDSLVTPHPIFSTLHDDPGKRRQAYRRLFRDSLSDEILTRVRDTTNACLVLGDDRFKNQIEKVLGRSVRHGRRGRPKKERPG
jgi:putative transposase